MPSRNAKRDPDADIAALIGVLRSNPHQVFECLQLRMQADVPKSLIRDLLKSHPSVNIIEGPKGTFRYQFRS